MKKRTIESTSAAGALSAPVERATAAGTSAYARRHGPEFVSGFYRETALDLTLSSIGLGTYLGECNEDGDAACVQAVRAAFASGINVVDTAINYRCQRAERSVGAALRQAISAGEVRREEVVLCTKGGYVPLDHTPPATRDEYEAYVRREFYDAGIVSPDDVVGGGHSLAPTFLKYCIARSRQNLGVRTIDLYYLHNPEQQLSARAQPEFRAALRSAFVVLEEAVARRDIGAYGVATWNGLRVAPGSKGHLSLEELVDIAREVAGDGHHFRVVQAPVNLALGEAVRVPTQQVGSAPAVTLVEAAATLGVSVVASASLMQGQLASGLPDPVRELFPELRSDAQRALAFVRGLPGVTTALVGTGNPAHLRELLDGARPAAR